MSYYQKRSKKLLCALFVLLFLTVALDAYYFWSKFNPPISISNVVSNNEYGVFCVGAERPLSCYWFNENGQIIQETQTIVGEKIIKINEISDYRPISRQVFLPDDLMRNFLVAISFFKKQDLPVDDIVLKRINQELAFLIPNTSSVRLSLRFNPINNLTGLKLFLDANQSKKFEYIDLRAENKIFYK